MVIRATVPYPGGGGQQAQLECFLDEFYPDIQTVQWFLNGEEIYHYGYKTRNTRLEDENIYVEDESIYVDEMKDTFSERLLALRKLRPKSEDEYKCRIISRNSDYMILGDSANLAIVDVSYPPEIIFEKNVYRVGDTLNATCVARYSSPASALDLRVNGNTIPPESGQVMKIKNAPPGLYTTTRHHTMPLSCSDEGPLNVTCRAHVLFAVLEKTVEIQVGPARSAAGVPRSTSISHMILTAILMLVLLCNQW